MIYYNAKVVSLCIEISFFLKKKFVILLSIGFFLNTILPENIHCQSISKPGLLAFSKRYTGAKGIGMGGAFESIVDDGSVIFWNPAQLTEIEKFNFSISDYKENLNNKKNKTKNDPFDISTDAEEGRGRDPCEGNFQLFLSLSNLFTNAPQSSQEKGFSKPTDISFSIVTDSEFGYFGLGYRRDQQLVKEFAILINETVNFEDYQSDVIYLGYALNIKNFSWGVTVKAFRELFLLNQNYGSSLSFGLSVEPIPMVRISVVAEDIGAIIFYKENYLFNKQDFLLKGSISVAIPILETTVSVTYIMNMKNNDYIINSGAKINLPYSIDLLVGLMDKKPTIGFGVEFQTVSIYYSARFHIERKDSSHHISTNYVI